VNKNRR